jgi:cytochrome c oxidase subunit 2
VVVMDPADYQLWLDGQPAGADPVDSGRVLFENLRCVTCHDAGSGQRGPNLAGLFGTTVSLADGGSALFDEDFVRTSILDPRRQVSAGFEAVMPTYEGQVTTGQINHLVAYIKSLAPRATEEEEGGSEE